LYLLHSEFLSKFILFKSQYMRHYILLLTLLLTLTKLSLAQIPFPVDCTTLSLTECSITTNCTSNSCQNVTINPCNNYSTVSTCQNAGCKWNGCTGGLPQGPSCNLLFNTSSACTAAVSNGCNWNTNTSNCDGIFDGTLQSCSDFPTMSSCQYASGCIYANGTCAGTYNGSKSCSQLPMSLCGNGCTPSCSGVPGISCAQFIAEQQCVSAGCTWNQASCVGNATTVNCMNFGPSICENMGCALLNTTCVNPTCPNIHDWNQCRFTQGCIWDRSTCVFNLLTNYGGLLSSAWGVFIFLWVLIN